MIKVAILSNVGIEYLKSLLEKEYEVYCPSGYGSVFEELMDDQSPLYTFKPQAVVLLTDLSTLTAVCATRREKLSVIEQWSNLFLQCCSASIEYFISDAFFTQITIEDTDDFDQADLQFAWFKMQKDLCGSGNVHRLALDGLRNDARGCFSQKMWYMGRTPFSVRGSKTLADEISHSVDSVFLPRAKLLIVDLDDTLWGGILGECGTGGINLSGDGIGKVYFDAQKMLVQMKQHGVVLAVCSKNNAEDVKDALQTHPYMLLRENDFALIYANWNEKSENIREIASRMNIGLDSIVFVDDSPVERALVRECLPEVIVPEFPEMKESIPSFWRDVYRRYFRKSRVLYEDSAKTDMYRSMLAQESVRKRMSHDSFLRYLGIQAEKVSIENEAVKNRVLQLIQKTNQFNLTGRRYDRRGLENLLSNDYIFYVFRIRDRFEDYGVTALLIADPKENVCRIDNFLMSCRVMGRQIERYIINEIEADLEERGYHAIEGEYIRLPKNDPVENLYESLGYEVIARTESGKRYRLELARRPRRRVFVNCDEKNEKI